MYHENDNGINFFVLGFLQQNFYKYSSSYLDTLFLKISCKLTKTFLSCEFFASNHLARSKTLKAFRRRYFHDGGRKCFIRKKCVF